jgi:hypothetical protein
VRIGYELTVLVPYDRDMQQSRERYALIDDASLTFLDAFRTFHGDVNHQYQMTPACAASHSTTAAAGGIDP